MFSKKKKKTGIETKRWMNDFFSPFCRHWFKELSVCTFIIMSLSEKYACK